MDSSEFQSGVVQLSPTKRVGEKRAYEDDTEEGSDAPKMTKMRDLEFVIRYEGLRSENVECSKKNVNMDPGNHNKKCISEVAETITSAESEGQITTVRTSLKIDDDLTLSLHPDGYKSSACHDDKSVAGCTKESESSDIAKERFNESSPPKKSTLALDLDLNAFDVSSMKENNPFYPYKKLGQLKQADHSECGSTSGPVEENESLRRWKEMKQNGFLSLDSQKGYASSSHGGVPVHKQRKPRKKKDVELKKTLENSKKEQANKLKYSHPTDLLSKLNPGIINKVRNSKQVHAIIEAIVRSEDIEVAALNRFSSQHPRTSIDMYDKRSMSNYVQESAFNHFVHCSNKPPLFSDFLNSEKENELENYATTALKLPTTMGSENACSESDDGFLTNEVNISSLSFRAANIASQWLELLEKDIRGRLTALRRSKRRVGDVIQTELPYLIATELMSHHEDEPSTGHSRQASLEKHAERWKSLFNQMDRALNDEGMHLEIWLRQVLEMQSKCQKGLKLGGSDCQLRLGGLQDSSASEGENALKAAAASLYSTCNMIIKRENVQCC